MSERAVFLSRTSAHIALVRCARQAGLSDERIASKGRTYAQYKRGQMIGYEAWYPMSQDCDVNIPVLEKEV